MKQQQFIKVIGSSITGVDGGRLDTTTARGIVRLKRGQTLLDFVSEFTADRGITAFQLNERHDGTWATAPMMFLDKDPKEVLTFMFKQFDHEDFGFHAKDLTALELYRDLEMLRKAGVSWLKS